MADDPHPQKIPLLFYRSEAGSEPVRIWHSPESAKRS